MSIEKASCKGPDTWPRLGQKPCDRQKLLLQRVDGLSSCNGSGDEGSDRRAYDEVEALANGSTARQFNVSEHFKGEESAGTPAIEYENTKTSHGLHYTYFRNEQSMSSAITRAACRLPASLASLCETGCIFRDHTLRHLACKTALRTECAAPCPTQPCPCTPCPKMEAPVKGKIESHLS